MDREDFIKDWLEGKISADDLEKKISGSDSDLKKYKKIIERSASFKVPQKRSKGEAWNLLEKKLEEKKPARVIKLNPWLLTSIAASVILLIVSYFIFLKPETVIAPKGAHIAYTLPDGSEVTLNADSRISFREFNLGDRRRVKLAGEAFFRVKAGGKFEVEGNNGTVIVLGTSFNVNQRDKIFAVACFTGAVKVVSKTGESVTLNAKEFTETKNNTLSTPLALEEEKAASWRDGDFYFESASVTEVFKEMERQFDIEIVYDGETDRNYTGYFNNNDLDEALQLVCSPMALKYRKEENRILVTSP